MNIPPGVPKYKPKMTTERAVEIWDEVTRNRDLVEWSEGVVKTMTPGEEADIRLYWKTLSGSLCFMDAFFKILQGRVEA